VGVFFAQLLPWTTLMDNGFLDGIDESPGKWIDNDGEIYYPYIRITFPERGWKNVRSGPDGGKAVCGS